MARKKIFFLTIPLALYLSLGCSESGKLKNTMVKIPAGTFLMGDSAYKKEISISAFWMDKYEVTNQDFQKCVDAGKCEPAHYTDSMGHFYNGKEWPAGIVPEQYRIPNLPVVCVDWFQADAYCKFAGKRLPTESEWEYAYRANTTTRYYWGDEIDGDYLWYHANSGFIAHQGGLKLPNAFGLYDMSGNVWEWVGDWYDEEYQKNRPEKDPRGPEAGKGKIFRGGCWVSLPHRVTADVKKSPDPKSPYNNNGFRCAKSQSD